EDGIRDFHVTGVQTCALPISLRWDSAATAIHDDPLALVFQDFAVDLSGILVDRTNVLAIQALNDSLSSSDFLVLPELRASGAGRSEERRVGKGCGSR